jgi:hypothetical protein
MDSATISAAITADRRQLTVINVGPEATSALRRELSDFGKTGTSAPGQARRFRDLAETSASSLGRMDLA